MSLRFRLALAIACITALVTAGVGVVVYDLARNDRIESARRAAAVDALSYADSLNQNARFPVPGVASVEQPSGRFPGVPDELRRHVRDGFYASVLTSISGSPYVVGGAPLADGRRVYVFRAFRDDELALESLRLTLLRVGIGATLLGALVGVLVASVITRPVARAATLARRLAAGDLEARLNPRGTDEIASLGRALDDMALALGTKIKELDDAASREQRFSADVAHELRTPITGIVAAASLLDDSPAARMVRERSAAMAALVQDLLEVMRLEGGTETARNDPFDLVRLVRDVVAQRAPDAHVEAPALLHVESDARRVERIVGNLVDNAVRHGQAPIRVAVSADGAVTVRDSGPGFGDFLDRAGDRFAMADSARGDGTGLGLAIVRGQAAVIGARLEFRDDHGAVATLRLLRRDPIVTAARIDREPSPVG